MEVVWNDLKKALLTSSVVIAAVTALGYLNAWLFEIGFLNYYGINYQVAHVTLEGFILFGVTILFVGFLFFSNRGLMTPLFSRTIEAKTPVSYFFRRKLKVFSLTLLCIVPISIYYHTWAYVLIFAVVAMQIAITDIFIDGRHKKGIKNKVTEASLNPKPNTALIDSDVPILLGIMLILFMLSVSALLGKGFAMSRSTYEVTDDGYILVRNYQDAFILAKYDSKGHKLTGDYVYLSDISTVKFRSQEIRNLKRW